MKKKTLFVLWSGLFIVCAGLGFIPEPAGALRWLLTGLSLVFFIPGVLLVFRASGEGDLRTLKLIRNLSAASLGLTLLLLVLSFLTVLSSPWLGGFLHNVLVIVSAPMVCSGYCPLSLFLWACLLVGSIQSLRNVS